MSDFSSLEILNNSDCISRRAAIYAVGYYSLHSGDKLLFADKPLKELPSVQPEIIRCKDCKHKYIEDGVWNCPFGLAGGEMFFCAYGGLGIVERREQDERSD